MRKEKTKIITVSLYTDVILFLEYCLQFWFLHFKKMVDQERICEIQQG